MDNSNNEHKLFSLNKFRKIKENCYNKKLNCEQTAKKYIQTNPRFPKFDQVYFHAGDMKDMNKYGLLPLRYFYSKENNGETIKKDIKDKTKEKLLTKVDPIYKLYKNIDYTSVLNSFHYMFDKFKKGIFVIIRNNKLVVFLPFSNVNYKNNWYKKTYFSLEEKKLLETEDYNKIKKQLDQNIIDFQRKYPDQFDGHKRKINFQRRDWYANNCNFRNQFPTYEGETNNNVYKNMLDELLKERTIPDVEFFINDRDFPILKKDFTEPYEHIFDSENIKIEDKYQYKKMAPIFSQSITNDFADMLMPTSDEWIMASNKYFSSKCTDAYDKSTMSKINTDWKSKKPICIFRGSATGCGMTIQNNMRLKAADLSMDHTDILDAGIIDWNARMKKYKETPIQIIDTTKFRFSLANKINNIEKSNYKYILNIDGHVSAFRLPSELSMNSVVLIVASKYKMWFSNLLIPFIHYVPVKDDLSDLIDQINWCIKNDAKCKKIASNGVEFYNKYLIKDGLFNYIEQQLNLVYDNKKLDNLLAIKKSKKNIALITCFRDKGNGRREKERKIFVQLMHTGRISHPLNMPKTAKILAPSAIKAKGQMWTDLMGMQDFNTPIPMSMEQIKTTITEYVVSSENAIKAGFDGVEIHGANGYLIEQFLNPESNARIDIYGGSIVNRARFLMEIVQGISNSIGQNRVGVRLSPYGRANDMPLYSNILNTYDYFASELNKLDISYIHLLNQKDSDVTINYNNVQSVIRSNFKNTLIICGGYDYNSAKNSIEHKIADLIAFGRPFINNPDLVERFKNNWEMSKDLKLDLFYSGGQEGYNDYPAFADYQHSLNESINN